MNAPEKQRLLVWLRNSLAYCDEQAAAALRQRDSDDYAAWAQAGNHLHALAAKFERKLENAT